MKTTPVNIHLKPNAIHTPIPIPHQRKQEIKKSHDADVEKSIINPVLKGEPVEWCSHMVVAAKVNEKPFRTIDSQKLNNQYARETHHCKSPF